MSCTVESSINASIDELLRTSGKSRTWLASELGMTTQALRNKRKGLSGWRWNEIKKLSKISGKSIDELAGITKA